MLVVLIGVVGAQWLAERVFQCALRRGSTFRCSERGI